MVQIDRESERCRRIPTEFQVVFGRRGKTLVQ